MHASKRYLLGGGVVPVILIGLTVGTNGRALSAPPMTKWRQLPEYWQLIPDEVWRGCALSVKLVVAS